MAARKKVSCDKHGKVSRPMAILCRCLADHDGGFPRLGFHEDKNCDGQGTPLGLCDNCFQRSEADPEWLHIPQFALALLVPVCDMCFAHVREKEERDEDN